MIRCTLAAAALLFVGLVTGCADAPAPVKELPPLEDAAFGSPESISRVAIETMQAELKAAAERDQAAVRAYRLRLTSLAATERIQKAVDRIPIYRAVVGDDAVGGVVTRWSSTIAYYAEGIELEQMKRGKVDDDAAEILVPARGEKDDATIRITCAKVGDRWRVSRVDFQRQDAAAPAETVPASAPS